VAPRDTIGRLDTRKRRTATEQRLHLLHAAGLIDDPAVLLAIVESAPDAPRDDALVVAHGDLHAGQLLVEWTGRLAGVIDWGDLHAGHPAVDLAFVHQLVPASLHEDS
jgi:aminoglycoside phosphotransferase (APT) family kinase protein